MYRAWSNRRHMQVEEISAPRNGGLPILLVTGFGAHRVLAGECGLHILEMIESGNVSNRATARVRLVATPLQDLPPAKLHDSIIRAVEKAPRTSAIVRRYRGEPSPLVRNADGTWRTGRLDAVLRGDFDLLAAAKVDEDE
jgi:ATP-dependent Clp protease ATP-binding subunit ClpC